jgi:multiple sugar transport system substrate-binding protein
MSTARLIILVFFVFAGLSVVAALWRPPKDAHGKTELVWTTGSNPARIEQIQAFNDAHPSHLLQLDVGNSDTQKILLQCCSGVGPDLFDVYDGEQLQMYAETGILWDITEAAREGGFSVDGDIWPAAREEVSYKGRQYAYPCNTGANIIIYNKNVFDHFGVPYPKSLMTWAEFERLAGQVNSRTRGGEASEPFIYAASGLGWQVFFESMGGQFFTEEGKPYLAGNPELLRALEMHRDFVFQKKLVPSSLELKSMSGQGGWGSGNLNQFASARFAMVVTGEWALIGLSRTRMHQLEEFKKKGIDPDTITNPLEKPLRLGCILIPHEEGAEPRYRIRSRSAAINVRSPKREEALLFLKFLSGKTYSELINRTADSLPGNPRFANDGVEAGDPALARVEIHQASERAMQHGYHLRRSPYLLTTEALRAVRKQVNRLESDPSLSIPTLLQLAQDEAETQIRRNILHNPELKDQYDRLSDTPMASAQSEAAPAVK